jgi:transketolase
MRNAFSDALVAAATVDPRVLLLTGDHGYSLFDSFRKAYPRQYINCGVAEQNMVGVAAGLAKAGFRPVVYGLAAFVPIRVIEQIKIDICFENLPVLLIGDGAGLVYSHLGTSHQSTEDIACTRSIPQLTVLSPADRYEMTAAMELAFRCESPVYLRIGKSDRGDVHTGPLRLQSGKMIQIRKGSARIALLATGSMVKTALELAEQGLDADVWSVPAIKPLSKSQLKDIASNADAVITLEEHSVVGGLGSAVSESLAEVHPLPVHRIGIEDRFSSSCGSWEHLLREHEINTKSVLNSIKYFLETTASFSKK